MIHSNEHETTSSLKMPDLPCAGKLFKVMIAKSAQSIQVRRDMAADMFTTYQNLCCTDSGPKQSPNIKWLLCQLASCFGLNHKSTETFVGWLVVVLSAVLPPSATHAFKTIFNIATNKQKCAASCFINYYDKYNSIFDIHVLIMPLVFYICVFNSIFK